MLEAYCPVGHVSKMVSSPEMIHPETPPTDSRSSISSTSVHPSILWRKRQLFNTYSTVYGTGAYKRPIIVNALRKVLGGGWRLIGPQYWQETVSDLLQLDLRRKSTSHFLKFLSILLNQNVYHVFLKILWISKMLKSRKELQKLETYETGNATRARTQPSELIYNRCAKFGSLQLQPPGR